MLAMRLVPVLTAAMLLVATPTLGQTCGPGGSSCGPDQFCKLPPRQCACRTAGFCAPLPQGCPSIVDPVCGCDGTTYGNECEAQASGVNVDHPGPCFGDDGRVGGLRFHSKDGIAWLSPSGATAFNVYRETTGPTLADEIGACLYAGLGAPTTVIPGQPAPGELWRIQVTAMLGREEGPLGQSSSGRERQICPCPCTLPQDVGPCDGAFPRWYHNYLTDDCQPFLWGGCEGNPNNFETLEACQAACTAPCVLPPDSGDCTAAFRRWFYSADQGVCHDFLWGGCGGNANNFETFLECQHACVCWLPSDVGPCDGTFPRWYHDDALGQCEPFVWGGCGGNPNNFETRLGCQYACEDICSLPADVGPCDAVVPRWFHNSETGQCELFIWGGCGGNANNFPTLEACAARCD